MKELNPKQKELAKKAFELYNHIRRDIEQHKQKKISEEEYQTRMVEHGKAIKKQEREIKSEK